LGIGGGPSSSSTSTSGGDGYTGITVNATPAITPSSIGYTLGGSNSSKLKLPEAAKPEVPYDGLTVSGNRIGNGFGVNLGGNQFGAPGSDASAFERLTQPEPAPETPVEDIIKVTGQVPGAVTPYAPIAGFDGAGLSPEVINKIDQPEAETPTEEEILVQARKAFNPVSVTAPLPTDFLPTGGLPPAAPTETISPEEILVEARKPLAPTSPGLSPEVLRAIEGPVSDKPATDEIVVTGQRPGAVTPYAPIAGVDTPTTTETAAEAEAKKKLGIKDYIDLATLLAGLIPEGKGGNGSGGTIPTGMGALSSLFSKQLPTSTLPRGGALPASTLAAQGFNSPQNYYRYGYGPEQSFFDYATQGAPNTSRAYTGYEGSTAEDAFAPQPVRMATPQITLPQPITTAIPDEPRGPSMYAPEVDSMRFARGGFAVEGAGDGRDDKIPALLSDGEYVIDAETVALLGNGSNKAGAKLLDGFRVKVRKQKGKKLARGKFSDNAKRPEQYMAGGPA
jgi:hypothetical protein